MKKSCTRVKKCDTGAAFYYLNESARIHFFIQLCRTSSRRDFFQACLDFFRASRGFLSVGTGVLDGPFHESARIHFTRVAHFTERTAFCALYNSGAKRRINIFTSFSKNFNLASFSSISSDTPIVFKNSSFITPTVGVLYIQSPSSK